MRHPTPGNAATLPAPPQAAAPCAWRTDAGRLRPTRRATAVEGHWEEEGVEGRGGGGCSDNGFSGDFGRVRGRVDGDEVGGREEKGRS